MMRYGFYLPTRGPLANRQDLSAILKAAESLGFASGSGSPDPDHELRSFDRNRSQEASSRSRSL